MIIKSTSKLTKKLNLSSKPELGGVEVVDGKTFSGYLMPRKNIEVENKWYPIFRIQDALRRGLINIVDYAEYEPEPELPEEKTDYLDMTLANIEALSEEYLGLIGYFNSYNENLEVIDINFSYVYSQLDLKYNSANFNSDWLTRLGTVTTDNLAQGSLNLYDKVVSLTEGGGISITGTYPNFTISSAIGEVNIDWGDIGGALADQSDLNSVLNTKYNSENFSSDWSNELAGITSDDIIGGLTNLYDQTVVLNEGTNISITGTYPEFTINADDQLSGITSDDITEGLANLYDQTVVLNEGTNISITGTYPEFTINAEASTPDFSTVWERGTSPGTTTGLATKGLPTSADNLLIAPDSDAWTNYNSAQSQTVAIGRALTFTGSLNLGERTMVGYGVSSGFASVAIGRSATTLNYGVCIGRNAQLNGDGGVCIGWTSRTGGSSVAVGQSHNFGYNPTHAVSIGNSCRVGNDSISIGSGTQAGSATSHLRNIAIGRGSLATSGNERIALGPYTICNVNRAIAIGIGDGGGANAFTNEVANTCAIGYKTLMWMTCGRDTSNNRNFVSSDQVRLVPSSQPTTAPEGAIYFDTTSKQFRGYNNSQWVNVGTRQHTPSSATDTGTQGDVCWDDDYIYVCTATDTWKRTAISTW